MVAKFNLHSPKAWHKRRSTSNRNTKYKQKRKEKTANKKIIINESKTAKNLLFCNVNVLLNENNKKQKNQKYLKFVKSLLFVTKKKKKKTQIKTKNKIKC